MSRFSPTVQPNSGQAFSDALGQTVSAYMNARRQKQQDSERLLGMGYRDETDDERGIREGTVAAPIPNAAAVNQHLARQLNPQVGLPAPAAAPEADPNEQQQFAAALGTPTRRVDTVINGRHVRMTDQAEAKLLAERALQRASLDHLQTQTGLLKNPRPKQTYDATRGVMVNEDQGTFQPIAGLPSRPEAPRAPVVGSPEWKDAQRFSAELGRSTFQSNHDYTVAHPTKDPNAPPKKPMSEWNQKADFMYDGVATAVPNIDKLDKDGVVVPQRADVPFIGNYIIGEKEQQMIQSAMVLHDAYLRLTTGATINPSELRQAAMQYIPMGGDSDALKNQKRERRAEVQAAIAKAGGRAPLPPRGGSAQPQQGAAPAGNVNLDKPAGRTVTVNGKTFQVPE